MPSMAATGSRKGKATAFPSLSLGSTRTRGMDDGAEDVLVEDLGRFMAHGIGELVEVAGSDNG